MLARIPVVLSQAPAAGTDARQLEEALIAELMFEPGVDVSVVPHLAQLREGTTGLLCLQGIKGDFVVLTWLEPEAARRLLLQRGVSGRDWWALKARKLELPRSVATEESPRPHRRMHVMQLDATVAVDHYVREIRRLRKVAELQPAQTSALPVLERLPEHSAADADPRSALEPRTVLPAGTDELDHLLDQLDALDL
jgi:hypothetical protein